MDEEREEWDGPWKEALEALGLVFVLFWPDVREEVGLERGWAPLEQELQNLTPDGCSGLPRVDKEPKIMSRVSFAEIIGREKGIE